MAKRYLTIKRDSNENLVEEIKIAQQLPLIPNLIKYWGTHEDDENIYLIYNFIKGKDLFETLLIKSFTEDEIFTILFKITKVLATLHEKNIGHMDISIENIMIDTYGEPYLIDFGQANTYDNIAKKDQNYGKLSCLDPTHMHYKNAEKLQVHMLGMCCFTMLFNSHAYNTIYDKHCRLFQVDRIEFIKQRAKFAGREISDKIINLIAYATTPDLDSRFTFNDLLIYLMI
jgi:hypothetical protein